MKRLERQLHAQQVYVDAPMVQIIMSRHIISGHIFRERIAETQPQMEVRMRRRQGFEMRSHHQLAAVAHTVEQPDFALRLFGQAPVQHAQHRRDADTASDQHHRSIAAVDMKMPGGGAHLQQAAHRHLLVKESG
jgi:hypothetical protein